MNLVRRLFPFRTCTIDIKDGERALPRPCLLYHIKRCQGPCIEAISKAAYRARHRPGRAVPRGPPGDAGRGAARTRWRAPRSAASTSRRRSLRDKIRAIERTMESQKMAAFARTELDLVGARPPGQPGGDPAVRRPQRQDDRARRVPPRRRPRRARRRGARELPRAVLRARDIDPARGPRAASRSPRRADLEAFLAERRGGPVHLRVPAARREAGADGARHAQRRPRRSRASRPAGWPTRAGRWRALEELADALGLPGPPLRIECYDISQLPGQRVGRQHGRVRGGQAAHRRVPPVPDPDGRGPERLREPPGGAPAPVPAGQGRARRATRRSAAGRCPTS